MDISPDVPLWQWEWIILNRTILFTWLVMAILVIGSWFITRRLTSGPRISRGQNLLEVLVMELRNQIREVSQQEPGPYMPFVGTLFLFIVVSNILSIVPGYYAPTSSISTTAALATCVFVAVPIYGIAHQGLLGYLKQYIQPSVFMLPFNIIGEFSRTLALAVRLYGNIMSGSVIGAILLGFVPLFVPILMQAFGLLTGMIQAYIFAVLAMVYIASATQNDQGPAQEQDTDNTDSQTTSTHTPTS
ncbi:MAG: F0F1 ATP synthase subunit A [Gimesia chilikensis]|uniref:F0F1 ATP synthase subunit A n=1 Tax=Gimesia chilikensis TaxID=2605989 RepID=UPI0037B95D07